MEGLAFQSDISVPPAQYGWGEDSYLPMFFLSSLLQNHRISLAHEKLVSMKLLAIKLFVAR